MEITTENLKQKIQNGDKLIIDFHGLWCGPCKIMKPTFDKVAEQMRNSNSEVQLYTMDVDINRDMVMELGLRGVPTIKTFSGGKEITSNTGILNETQLINLVDQLSNG
jgi:thioredoxin 1